MSDDGVAEGAVHAMREWASKGLDFNCTFVDDDMMLIVGLAQRAILAGLAEDCDPSTLGRMKARSEEYRQMHEDSLGFPIVVGQPAPRDAASQGGDK